MPCGSTLNVNLTAIFTYIKIVDVAFHKCISTFEGQFGSNLIAKFTAYDIEEQFGNEDGHCGVESIQLYNSFDQPLLGECRCA